MKFYTLNSDEQRVLKDLAYMVLKSKLNVGQRMRDTADSARRILSNLPPAVPANPKPKKTT